LQNVCGWDAGKEGQNPPWIVAPIEEEEEEDVVGVPCCIHCTMSLIQTMENLMKRFANVIQRDVQRCSLRHFRF
jgi:hypothetical protein